jgi:hypothetical protein
MLWASQPQSSNNKDLVSNPNFIIQFGPNGTTPHLTSDLISYLDQVDRDRDHPYNFSKRDQFFQYVGGEGGTGKTRIIKAVVVAMTLLRRQHEVVLTVPTGSAA